MTKENKTTKKLEREIARFDFNIIESNIPNVIFNDDLSVLERKELMGLLSNNATMKVNRLQSLLLIEQGFSSDVQSQRYTNYSDANFIFEGYELLSDTHKQDIENIIQEMLSLYTELNTKADVEEEDARGVLPLAMPCYATMNITGNEWDILSQLVLTYPIMFESLITNNVSHHTKNQHNSDESTELYDNIFNQEYESLQKSGGLEIMDSKIAGLSALVCTNDLDFSKLCEKINTDEKLEKIINNVACNSGHVGILEKVYFKASIHSPLYIYNQLKRHRIANWARESIISMVDRFINDSHERERVARIVFNNTEISDADFNKFYPKVTSLFNRVSILIHEIINDLFARESENIAKKDIYSIVAQLVPFVIDVKYILNDNIADFCHITRLRVCNRAQSDNRAIIMDICDRIFRESPIMGKVIKKIGAPGCVRGKCPEGKKCCIYNENVLEWAKVGE